MAEPTGECWCGCGGSPEVGFFMPGHDAKALHAAQEILYGRDDPTAHGLEAHGFHPGGKKSKELRAKIVERERRRPK